MGFITSLLVLSLLVFFHELGHFLVARYFGVKVETFSVGFGNKIFKKHYKGTEYCISSIPLGGYVKMKGQDDLDPKKESFDSDSYNSKTPLQKIGILLAGPFANFIVAFFLFIIIGFLGVQKTAPVIGQVVENSPAQNAGLIANDKILAINGAKIEFWMDLSSYIKESYGSLLFTIERDGKVTNLKVSPKVNETKNIFGESVKRRLVGIAPSNQSITKNYYGLDAISFGFTQTIESSKMIFLGVIKLIEGVISPTEVGGVISIFQVTSKASEVGIVALLSLTALISVNLGVLNLLPIPALDGGHIIFNLYEFITRKKASMKIVYKLTILGWIILLALMVLGVYNDINRLISG